jgi:site-specific DNA-cytosine methylase
MVSKANQERDESGRQHAVTLIEWYIEFAMSSSATSWSMEQVATPIVLECIEKYRNKRTPNHKFAYTVFNFNNMGVPQNRKRLIAGSPDVVARLLRIDQWQRCAKDVLVHPRGTHIRNYMRNSSPKPDPEGKVKWVYKWYTDDEACVPITGPSHCVIAGQFLRWATPYSGKELMMFTTGEMAALQCFPKRYIFHGNSRTVMRCIGNAIPPIIMFQMLRGRPPKDPDSRACTNMQVDTPSRLWVPP